MQYQNTCKNFSKTRRTVLRISFWPTVKVSIIQYQSGEILISLFKNKTNECSTLGTLLNDSLYILKLNLAGEDSKEVEALEIIL